MTKHPTHIPIPFCVGLNLWRGHVIPSSTSAYPDALRCLEDADCAEDNLHTSLVKECVFNQCTEQYACVGENCRSNMYVLGIFGLGGMKDVPIYLPCCRVDPGGVAWRESG